MSTSDGEEASPKPGIRGWFRDLSRTKKTAAVIVTVAGGLVTVGTAIGMIFSVVTWLFPSVQRPPPPTKGGTTLSNLEVVRNDVTLGDYLLRRPRLAKGQGSQVSQERRQRLGSIIRFDLELRGLAGKKVSLKWSVFYADTGKPVRGLTGQPAWPKTPVRPQTNNSENQFETWVPFPVNNKGTLVEGTFLVTLDVYATIEGSEVRLRSEEVKVSTPEKRTETASLEPR